MHAFALGCNWCLHVGHWGLIWLSAHVSCRSVYLSANNMISTVCSCIGV